MRPHRRETRHHGSRHALVLALASILGAASGWSPMRLPSPIGAAEARPRTPQTLDLTSPDQDGLDARLSELAKSRDACLAAMQPPAVEAAPVADRRIVDGCGWTNAVRVKSVGGAKVAIATLTCPMAAGLAMWMVHVVQPVAERHLKSRVASLRHGAGHACRNIIGDAASAEFRSEHATANAVDIVAFQLADGRRMSVATHWRGDGLEARFLREVHKGACRYFHVVLGPDDDAAHHDHFHFDRGEPSLCE